MPEPVEMPVSLLLKILYVPVMFPECLQVFGFVSAKIRNVGVLPDSVQYVVTV